MSFQFEVHYIQIILIKRQVFLLVLVTKIRVCKSSVLHARGPDPPSQKQHFDAIEFSDQSSLIAKGHELKCQAKTLV